MLELQHVTFDVSDAGDKKEIIRDLDLKKPRYQKVAAYGHFGRPDLDLPWERTDRVDDLKEAAEAYK